MNAIRIAKRAAGAAVVVDEENRILAVNEQARLMLERSQEELIGENFIELFAARDIFGNRLSPNPFAFYEMVKRAEAIRRFQLDLQPDSGARTRVHVSAILVPTNDSDSYNLVYELRPALRRRQSDRVISGLAGPSTGEGSTGDAPPRSANLTPRQLEVLRLIAEGLSSKETAQRLGVSVSTVRTHVQRILRIMNAHSQLEAVAIAHRWRLL